MRDGEGWVVGRCGEAGKGENSDGLHGSGCQDNVKMEGVEKEQRNG